MTPNPSENLLGSSDRLQLLIDATGFDTFEQALEFVREQREISNWAEAPAPKPSPEKDRIMLESLRDNLQRQIDELPK